MIKYKLQPLFATRASYNSLSIGINIYFSGRLYEEMDKPVYVSFHYDMDNKAVGVEVHEDKGPGRYKLTSKKENKFFRPGASCGNQQLKSLLPRGRYIFVGQQDGKFICVQE